MSFPQEQPVVADRRGGVSIVFYIPDPDKPEEEIYGKLGVQIKYSDGNVLEKTFDLLARLQDDAEGRQLLAGLNQLKDYIINRIESEVLG